LEGLKEINKSLSEAIRNSDLQGISVEIAETLVDSMLDDGILKNLPFVGSIVAIGKTAISIKDQIFLKKIIFFLSGIRHVSIAKRRKMIDFVNDSKEQKTKVGEKLIYILDKCDDYISAKYIAQFFCAFLDEKINYCEFLKGSRIIQNIFIEDLEYFLEKDASQFQRHASSAEAPDEDEFPLINVGILGFGYNTISVEDHRDYEISGDYLVKGGEAVIWITSIGNKLKKTLKKEKI